MCAMGASSCSSSSGVATHSIELPAALPDDLQDLSPLFVEVLNQLTRHAKALGGLRHFKTYPSLDHGKVKREEFKESYSDFEYAFLTVVGLGRLHNHCEEIVAKNNAEEFHRNPGVKMLEQVCGMTMHADRPGANALLRTAAPSLLEAFNIAKSRKNGMIEFFRGAFDRTADPCLEGRVGRLLDYVQEKGGATHSADSPPWEDVSLKPLPGAKPMDIVGEHLRVFMNESTWTWSRERGMKYEDAKAVRLNDANADAFSRLFNAEAFQAFLLHRGAILLDAYSWEVATDDRGTWTPYDPPIIEAMERARRRGQKTLTTRIGPKGWTYELDLQRLVQRNPKTQKERPIRCVAAPTGSAAQTTRKPGTLTLQEAQICIDQYVDLCTLPRRPPGAT
eukprot:TRINITY_DN41544_c0_g2_i12.p1 TRINITY_DN41544_c0_g2~~TRINITY_DN41544_c0_g2_i12.p1  ORF type:complete len:392 (-),score=56.04 TRINITY_DN41544_c0_g2_i12:403-1578(-)